MRSVVLSNFMFCPTPSPHLPFGGSRCVLFNLNSDQQSCDTMSAVDESITQIYFSNPFWGNSAPPHPPQI